MEVELDFAPKEIKYSLIDNILWKAIKLSQPAELPARNSMTMLLSSSYISTHRLDM